MVALSIAASLHYVTAAKSEDRATAVTTIWPTSPLLKPNGEKWRIGYYEGGQYPDYEIILRAIVRGLMAIGWIDPQEFPSTSGEVPGSFWRWAASNLHSEFLEFVPDGYYAAGDFDKTLRPKVKKELLDRLKSAHDIDLMLALGTWAGQDLAGGEVRTPVIVASTSDPVGAGIVKSETDSGHDNVHAKVEPHRYAHQVELFHDVFHFKKLGIVYEDSIEGRTFAAVEDITRIAAARGFEIVACHAPFNNLPQADVERGVVACYEDIAKRVDAAYVSVHRGLTKATLSAVLRPLIALRIPTFSMLGETEVKAGALMSVAQSNYVYVGLFHAETIARIFNGASPRSLSQIWQAPAKIAINLNTAEAIGYRPHVDTLLASDEIFVVRKAISSAAD